MNRQAQRAMARVLELVMPPSAARAAAHLLAVGEALQPDLIEACELRPQQVSGGVQWLAERGLVVVEASKPRPGESGRPPNRVVLSPRARPALRQSIFPYSEGLEFLRAALEERFQSSPVPGAGPGETSARDVKDAGAEQPRTSAKEGAPRG